MPEQTPEAAMRVKCECGCPQASHKGANGTGYCTTCETCELFEPMSEQPLPEREDEAMERLPGLGGESWRGGGTMRRRHPLAAEADRLRGERDHLIGEVERLREALAELVRLKNEKDRGVFRERQAEDKDAAWNAARAALALAAHPEKESAPMVTMVCLYCGHTPSPGSITLGTPCMGCGKVLILTPEESR